MLPNYADEKSLNNSSNNASPDQAKFVDGDEQKISPIKFNEVNVET